MSVLYDFADEPAHLHAIDMLAKEASQPVALVTEIYITELARLKVGARIKDFLVVLTCRKVREGLRRRRVAAPLSRPRSTTPAMGLRGDALATKRVESYRWR
jgi:hypothetical protein